MDNESQESNSIQPTLQGFFVCLFSVHAVQEKIRAHRAVAGKVCGDHKEISLNCFKFIYTDIIAILNLIYSHMARKVASQVEENLEKAIP